MQEVQGSIPSSGYNYFLEILVEYHISGWKLTVEIYNVTLAPINKFYIKNLINANYKDKEPP